MTPPRDAAGGGSGSRGAERAAGRAAGCRAAGGGRGGHAAAPHGWPLPLLLLLLAAAAPWPAVGQICSVTIQYGASIGDTLRNVSSAELPIFVGSFSMLSQNRQVGSAWGLRMPTAHGDSAWLLRVGAAHADHARTHCWRWRARRAGRALASHARLHGP
jgi:hypothetical protein